MSEYSKFFVGTKVKILDDIIGELEGRTGEVVGIDHDTGEIFIYVECEEDELIEGEYTFLCEDLEIIG